MVSYLVIKIMFARLAQVERRPKEKFRGILPLAEKNKIITAVGMISGTSLDGIDASIIKSDGETVERTGKVFHRPYKREEQELLKEALAEARKEGRPTTDNRLINKAEALVSKLHSAVVNNLLAESRLAHEDIDIVGFHGQTILHGPDEGWTWQIGDGAKLARSLGIPVVNDLRSNDMAHGGEGAPLACIYHHVVASQNDVDYPIAMLNMGGVGNITWIGGPDPEKMLAFDTGPANALLDDLVRRHTDLPYDRGGEISAKGMVDREMVSRWMQNPYFKQPIPKSLDRDEFNVDAVNALPLEDGAATLCAFSVECVRVAEEMCPAPVKHWYVCGGGAHNPVIMSMLSDALDGSVEPVDVLGFEGDYIEAEAFALMAIRKLYDLPNSFPGTTGVSRPVTGGVLNKP